MERSRIIIIASFVVAIVGAFGFKMKAKPFGVSASFTPSDFSNCMNGLTNENNCSETNMGAQCTVFYSGTGVSYFAFKPITAQEPVGCLVPLRQP